MDKKATILFKDGSIEDVEFVGSEINFSALHKSTVHISCNSKQRERIWSHKMAVSINFRDNTAIIQSLNSLMSMRSAGEELHSIKLNVEPTTRIRVFEYHCNGTLKQFLGNEWPEMTHDEHLTVRQVS